MVFTLTSKNVNITEEDKGCTLKQFLLPFVVSLPFFTHGVESNNLTISAHSGHFTTHEAVPWTSTALVLAAIFSTLPHSYSIDVWGRKFGIYIVILLQGASCIPLLLPPTEIGFIILHVLSGISTAGLYICVPAYILEISTMKSRGSMISIMMVMTSAGYLTRLGMCQEERLYLIAAMVMLQFMTLFMVVESSSYLVKVGKVEAAKVNYGKLKCLSASDSHVVNEVKRLEEESERAKCNGQLTMFRIFKNPIWRDEMKVGFVLFTTTILSGCIIFLDQDKTLAQLKTSVDPENMMVPVCLFVGALVCVNLVRILERKYLLTCAYAVMALSMGTLAVFTQADLTVTSTRWLPVVSLAVLVFAYGVAWGLPTVIMVEMLNFEIRARVLGIIYTYAQILRVAHVHTFWYLEEHVGIYTLLYIFACINLFGAVYTISSVPNIKNKTIREIEKQMKRIPLIKL